jgi:heme-degrading monooxygenase HmoA
VISRHWKGVTKPGFAEAYLHHLRSETLPRLVAIAGFVEAWVLRRDVEEGAEFQVITVWESLGAVEAFAGPQADLAVVPDAVQAMLSTYDERVRHYDVVERFTPREATRPGSLASG